MFKAFLFDYKRKQSFLKSLRKLGLLEWVFLSAILLSSLHFIVFASELELFETLTMLLIMFAALGAELLYSSVTSPSPKEQAQMNFYLTKRVQPVEDMLNEKVTGLPVNKCVDLLLRECDAMLKCTRPSETFKTRIKPILKFPGALFGILFSAYMCKGNSVSLPESELSLANQIGTFISKVLSISPDLLPSFVLLAILATVFYLYIVLFIIPYCCIPLLDRNWILAQELRDILTYIKEKNSNTSSEPPSEEEASLISLEIT